MSKHTEGPWEHGTHFAGGTDILAGPIGSRVVVARVIDNSLLPFPEYVANARLIAAAPDLLAALSDLLDWGRENTSPRDENSPHTLLVAALSAIAKAKGETP